MTHIGEEFALRAIRSFRAVFGLMQCFFRALQHPARTGRRQHTEGQGRDFKSEVLILINSHRAGTANISKLSIADVERVEIVRGPASVVYGSQNMGGVVNIILKTGRTAEPGTFIEGAGGSWNYVEGKVQNAGNTGTYDWYAGGNAGRQGDYQVGGGQVELNTAWNRYGGTVAFGWQIDPNNRIDVTARSDGVYGTGFRGSSANIFANDNRYNDSIDFTWHGKTPCSSLQPMSRTAKAACP